MKNKAQRDSTQREEHSRFRFSIRSPIWLFVIVALLIASVQIAWSLRVVSTTLFVKDVDVQLYKPHIKSVVRNDKALKEIQINPLTVFTQTKNIETATENFERIIANQSPILNACLIETLASKAEQNVVEEPLKPEIAVFDSVQENNDYRIHLLGITKGIAFLNTQEMISDGERSPGENVIPWMRVTVVIEKLTNKNESFRFTAETSDGAELVGKTNIEVDGRVAKSRSQGTSEFDLDSPKLRGENFPTAIPAGLTANNAKVYVFTLSGKFASAEMMVLRFSFDNKENQRDILFQDVPIP